MVTIPETGRALLKFSAPWCGPCKALSAVMKGIEIPMPVVEINIDEEYSLAEQYGVRGVPTVVIIDNGQEVARKVGNIPQAVLQQLVSS